MALKDIYVLFLETMNVILYGKMDFAIMIKLRVLRWEYLELSKRALNVITSVFIRGKQRELSLQSEERVIWRWQQRLEWRILKMEEYKYKPKNTGKSWKCQDNRLSRRNQTW